MKTGITTGMKTGMKTGMTTGTRARRAAVACLFGLTGLLGLLQLVEPVTAQRSSAPTFQVDPFWPKVPAQWTLGQVTGVSVDSRDHVWILHRAWSIQDDEKAQNPEAACCREAPPVMEFDENGNYVQGWGGPGAGYEWPADEHAIHVDYKNNVWISSAGGPRLRERTENQILKFTRDGKFLMQIGKRGASKGSLDTENFNNPADIQVFEKTNEVFVADGYVNRRVIVMDADTGKFKRMWGGRTATSRTTARPTVRPTTDRDRSSSTWCTASRCRRTATSTSPNAATTACRCSRSTASSKRRSSSSARRSCWERRSRSPSHPTRSSSSSTSPMPATA